MSECFSVLPSSPTPQHRTICQHRPASLGRVRYGVNTISVGVKLQPLLPVKAGSLHTHSCSSSRGVASLPPPGPEFFLLKRPQEAHPALQAPAAAISLERCPCCQLPPGMPMKIVAQKARKQAVPGLRNPGCLVAQKPPAHSPTPRSAFWHTAPSGWRTKQSAPRQRLTDLMIEGGLLPMGEPLLQQTVQLPRQSQLQRPKCFKRLFIYICILKIKRLST